MPHPAITDDMRRWVETWKQAGPELAAIRREELKVADNVRSLEMLESMFNHATRTHPPRVTSGMVHMQELFSKLRNQAGHRAK